MKKNVLITIAVMLFIAVPLFFLYFKNSPKYFSDTKVLWKFEAKEIIASTPVSNDNYIYIRTQEKIYALNLYSGKQIWKNYSKAGKPLILQPVITEKYLIAPENKSRIAVFSATHGTMLWRSPEIKTTLTDSDLIDIQSIVANDNVVYVARFNWSLTAYSLQSGKVLWEYDLSGRSNPYLAINDHVILVGLGSTITALDPKNGKYLWAYNVNGYVGPLVLDKNDLFVIDEKHSKIFAIDLSSQSTKWVRDLQIEPFEFNCIAINANSIYVSSQKLVSISRSTGQAQWKSDYTDRLECPVFWKNKIIVRNTSTTLFLINNNTGEIIDRYSIGFDTSMKHFSGRSPLVKNDLLFTPINDYTLFAIDLNR